MYVCTYVCIYESIYKSTSICVYIGTKILTKKLGMCEYRTCVYLGKYMHILVYGHLDSNIHVSIEMPNIEIM